MATTLVVGFTTIAMGATPAKAQSRAEMDAMREQIRVLQRRMEEMQRSADARADEARRAQEAARRTPPPAAPARDEARVTMSNGRPTFRSADGNFTLGITGRVHFDVGTYFQGSGGARDNRPEAVRDLNSGSTFRRARLGVAGTLYRDFEYALTADFGGSPDGVGNLFEAWIGYTGLKPFNFRIGAFKPSLTLEDTISSNDTMFLERAAIVNTAISLAAGSSRTAAGVSASGERWYASTYFTGSTVGTEADDEQTGGTIRAAFLPVRTDDLLVHVGASASMVFEPNQTATGAAGVARTTVQLRDRPELRIDSNRLVDTGAISADGAYTAGVELAARYRSLTLQAEYVRIGVDQSRLPGQAAPDLAFDGYYVQGSWFVTGERRGYSNSSAAFRGPERILRPLNFGEPGGFGAIELALRYSYLNLDDGDRPGVAVATSGGVRGGEQRIFTAGINWYPQPTLRFMLNYLYGEVDRRNAAGTTQIGQDFHALALRTQFYF